MVFSSLLFVFAFLVISYGIYLLVSLVSMARAKRTDKGEMCTESRKQMINTQNIVLLISSLIFYTWGGPPLVLLLALMTFICYTGAIAIEKQRDEKAKNIFCWITCLICLSLLFVFKYAGFAISTFKDIFSIGGDVVSIALPIGISFYTFQLISYVIDVKRGEVPAERKYWVLLLYASLFHQCIAGPIVRYADVNYDIHHRKIDLEEMSRGFMRFGVGLAKKAILANGCAAIADSLIVMDAGKLASTSSLGIILGMLCYMLQIYLDFSAYSDMAIGMGLMIGFHYKENFNYPYVADSVTDFWRRWHISLSSFFRDYVYIPLGGNRVGVPRQILNLLCVWVLTGFWHGASWNYLLWGLYYFIFLILEKFIIKPKKNPAIWAKIPRILITLVIVFFGWMLFKFEDLSLLGVALGSLFTSEFTNTAITLKLTENVFFLILCVLACMPIVPKVDSALRKSRFGTAISDTIVALCPIILIALSALALAGDTYNPFLYFQF